MESAAPRDPPDSAPAGMLDARTVVCCRQQSELGALLRLQEEELHEPAEVNVRRIGYISPWRIGTLSVIPACSVAFVLACAYAGHPWAAGPAHPAVDDAIGLRRDVGMLHWKGHARKCLDVEGGSTATGTRVQLYTCRVDNRNERFIFPRTQGMIHWAAHPHLCLHVNGGNLKVGTHIVLDHCDKEYDAMQWTMPHGDGPIRLRDHPELCIDEHNKHRARNGFNALLGHCPESDPAVGSDRVWKEVTHPARGQAHLLEDNNSRACLRVKKPVAGEPILAGECGVRSMETQFVFPGRYGVIRWAPYPHLCLHAATDSHEIRLAHCRTQQRTMQWEVPNGPGPVRLLHDKSRCLSAEQPAGGKVRTLACGAGAGAAAAVPAPSWDFVKTPHKEWGSPSLLCWVVMRPGSYEEGLMKAQLDRAPGEGKDLGIFDCDEFHVLSVRRRKLGWHHQHGWIHTHHFKGAHVGRTEDGTAGNTRLFLHAWAAVRHHRRYIHHPWTIKADPDCVVIPDRLRYQLRPHTGGPPSYLVNCNAYPDSPHFPMIYGALEAFSKHALTNFFGREQECMALNWYSWGEDVFMMKCMQRLGVRGVNDFNIVGDKGCKRHATCHGPYAAFHPYKSIDKWIGCYHAAAR